MKLPDHTWLRHDFSAKSATCFLLALIAVTFCISPPLAAQNAQPPAKAPAAPPPPKTGRLTAPVDFTGYWVSIVNEDWRFRMMVPDKGDYQSVPLNPDGTKAADAWNPEKDQADGNQCKSYGAATIMRVPGRLHIFWADDNTLRVDTDSGTQTRLLHFGGNVPQGQMPQWQGYSIADWEGMRSSPRKVADNDLGQEGYLKVETSHLKPGYLRKNGVPYSVNAQLEEYFDTFKEINGDIWLVVTTIVTDPQYLTEPFITSTHFKKLAGNTGWDPTPCRVNEPR